MTGINDALKEAQRDARVAYYLGQLVPKESQFEKLRGNLKNPNDLYEYLLLDNQVANNVITSRVAQAMASLQQYISGIMMHIEPGYNEEIQTVETREDWQNNDSRYPIWAANQQIRIMAENYIDPTLRIGKTKLFEQLETTLNQGKITEEAVEGAVLAYLNGFEEVANLEVTSGYENGTARDKDTYYFIGRTRTQPYQYYWRMLDMSKKGDTSTLPPTAWSDWKKIDLPVEGGNVVDTPRPVFFNNRLYVFWVIAELREEPSYSTSESESKNEPKRTYLTKIYLTHKLLGNGWSTPQLMQSIGAKEGETYGYLAQRLIVAINNDEKIFVVADKEGETPIACAFDALLTELDKPDTQQVNSLIKSFGKSKLVGHPYASLDFDVGSEKLSSPTPNPALPVPATIEFPIKGESGIDFKLASMQCSIYKFANFNGVKFSCSVPNADPEAKCSVTLSNFANLSFVEENENTAIKQLPAGSLDKSTAAISEPSTDFVATGIDLEFPIKRFGPQDGKIVISFDKDGKYKSIKWEIGAIPKGKITVHSNQGDAVGEMVNVTELALTADVTICPSDKDGKKNPPIKNGSVPLDGSAQTFSLDGNAESAANIDSIYYYLITATVKDGSNTLVESSTLYRVNLKLKEDSLINVYIDATNGAQFLDLSKVVPSMEPKTIRLNTLFGKKLVALANKSIDSLLQWSSQLIKEPGVPEGAADVPMDFKGANSLYFWELFFHMPFLVAWRLNLEQRYQESADWLHYIFNPYDKKADIPNKKPPYWNVRPISEDLLSSIAGRLLSPSDPDQIAVSDPVRYRKAVYMKYVRNMIDRGDAAYRELTPDGLTSAKLWYVAALDLMGARPDTNYTSSWTPATLKEIADSHSPDLRQLEQKLLPTLSYLPAVHDVTMRAADVDDKYFRNPLNSELLDTWTTLESRLYNLRHSLTLDGKPLSLPLFAPMMNPRDLLALRANGAGGVGSLTLAAVAIPPYRFPMMLGKAQQAVDTLIQYGNNLLSLLERKDGRDTEQLQLSQQLEVLGFTLDLQQQAITMAQASLEGLAITQRAAKERRDHYRGLYDENISSSERQAMDMRTAATAASAVGQGLFAGGAAADLAPNIFGFAGGGMHYGAPLQAGAYVAQLVGSALEADAYRIEASQQFLRRRQEWELQYKQADLDADQAAHQIEVQKLQLAANRTQLQQVQLQQKHTKAMMEFLSARFTSATLYQWLIGQLSALYFQAYDAVVSLCMAAESSWQYEMGEFTTRFIQPGAWSDLYKGLLSGETLKLALNRMDQAYLMRNERRLEVVKTISLKALLGDEWGNKLKSGVLDFDLREQLFAEDYPGHYLRQLVAVTVSLPAVTAPYQDVRAVLTQTSNALLTKPDIEGAKYLMGKNQSAGDNVKVNLRASQQIVLSTGIDDSGLFVLNFSDERYLPFEGTGAVSKWQLSFPNPQSDDRQKALLENLTDIIIRVRYTAKDGGPSYAQTVQGELKN